MNIYGFRVVGKKIYHRFIDDEEKKWYTGKIIRAVGDVKDKDSEFEETYEDGD